MQALDADSFLVQRLPASVRDTLTAEHAPPAPTAAPGLSRKEQREPLQALFERSTQQWRREERARRGVSPGVAEDAAPTAETGTDADFAAGKEAIGSADAAERPARRRAGDDRGTAEETAVAMQRPHVPQRRQSGGDPSPAVADDASSGDSWGGIASDGAAAQEQSGRRRRNGGVFAQDAPAADVAGQRHGTMHEQRRSARRQAADPAGDEWGGQGAEPSQPPRHAAAKPGGRRGAAQADWSDEFPEDVPHTREEWSTFSEETLQGQRRRSRP